MRLAVPTIVEAKAKDLVRSDLYTKDDHYFPSAGTWWILSLGGMIGAMFASTHSLCTLVCAPGSSDQSYHGKCGGK